MGTIYLGEQNTGQPASIVPQKSLVADVMYAGDRGVGKTSLVKKIINTQSGRIKVSNITNITRNVLDFNAFISKTGNIPADLSNEKNHLEMQVRLLATVGLDIDWVDTPGEIWRYQWQQSYPQEWDKVKGIANNSKAIIVVLPPHRDMGNGIDKTELIDLHQIPNRNQWCNRFERWVKFFLEDCPQTEQIILCINKADLFCDIEVEANKLAYNPSCLTMDWVDRNNYVIDKYFSPIKAAIAEINRNRYGLVVRCFITSIYSRTLIDLPWIYLASYL